MLRPILFAAAAFAATSAHASPYRSGPLEVSAAWSRPAVAGFNGVGYMTLANHGARPATLAKVESPLARAVEVHRSSLQAGVMSMAPVEKVEIPAGGKLAFAPGGYHLMFMGLKKTLKPGDRLPATLVFVGGRRIAATFQVTSGEPPEAPSSEAGRSGERSHLMTKK